MWVLVKEICFFVCCGVFWVFGIWNFIFEILLFYGFLFCFCFFREKCVLCVYYFFVKKIDNENVNSVEFKMVYWCYMYEKIC